MFNSPMAKQFNGPVINSLLEARHNIYQEDEEFLTHRSSISLATATEEELTLIGKFLSITRPYVYVNGTVEYCSVEFYRMYIENVMFLRNTRSLLDLNQMLSQFMPEGEFFLEFLSNGDIHLTIDKHYENYLPFFQLASEEIFTSLPKLAPIDVKDFSKFVWDHCFYARLVLIADSDWRISIEDHGATMTASGKITVQDHCATLTVDTEE
jgi:hypothetical protein